MAEISQATPESVWAALRELAERKADTDRQLKEGDLLRRENERILNEKFAETDRMMKEASERQAETDRQMKETDRQLKLTDRQITNLSKMIGGVSNNHGSFAEEYFINSFKKGKRNFFGEKYDKLVKFELVEEENKTKAEYDILLVNGKSVAIIEVKFKAHDKNIGQVINKVRPFRQKFPEYQNHKVYLGLASMVFDEKLEQDCIQNGIAVIKQSGDKVVIYDENIKAY